MFDSNSDSAVWSTSAEMIAGLVVAIVFADVARTEPVRKQARWFATLRWAGLVAIVGGLAACLIALAGAQGSANVGGHRGTDLRRNSRRDKGGFGSSSCTTRLATVRATGIE